MTAAVIVDDHGGAKPWLVMVHAMSQDHRVFSSQVDGFRGDYRMLLIDLPGHGLSRHVEGPLGHIEFADHIRDVMRENRVERCLYWGTHTGSSVGLLLAAGEPQLFSHLVLEGPVRPGGNPPVATRVLDSVMQTARTVSVEAGLEQWWQTGPWFELMRAQPERYRAAEHRAIIGEFSARLWLEQRPGQPITEIEAALATIETPSLIYNGEADHPDFLAEAKAIGGLLRNVTMIRVAECGGFPAWENPSVVNQAVRDFLGDKAG